VVPLEASSTFATINEVSAEATNKGLSLEATRRCEISRFEFGATPAHEFTLAAYGLGDFENPSGRKISRVPYYAAAIALAAFLAGIVLQRIARAGRRRRESTSGDNTAV